jgi:hypothetical protein
MDTVSLRQVSHRSERVCNVSSDGSQGKPIVVELSFGMIKHQSSKKSSKLLGGSWSITYRVSSNEARTDERPSLS